MQTFRFLSHPWFVLSIFLFMLAMQYFLELSYHKEEKLFTIFELFICVVIVAFVLTKKPKMQALGKKHIITQIENSAFSALNYLVLPLVCIIALYKVFYLIKLFL